MSVVITDITEYLEAVEERKSLKLQREIAITGFDQQIKIMDESVYIPIDLFFLYCKDIKSDVTVPTKIEKGGLMVSNSQYRSTDPSSSFGIHVKPAGDPNFCQVTDEEGLIWLRDVADNEGAMTVESINKDYVEIHIKWLPANVLLSFKIPTLVLMGKDDGYAKFHELITEVEMGMEDWNIVGKTVENAELTYLETLIGKYPEFAKEIFSKSGDCK